MRNSISAPCIAQIDSKTVRVQTRSEDWHCFLYYSPHDTLNNHPSQGTKVVALLSMNITRRARPSCDGEAMCVVLVEAHRHWAHLASLVASSHLMIRHRFDSRDTSIHDYIYDSSLCEACGRVSSGLVGLGYHCIPASDPIDSSNMRLPRGRRTAEECGFMTPSIVSDSWLCYA